LNQECWACLHPQPIDGFHGRLITPPAEIKIGNPTDLASLWGRAHRPAMATAAGALGCAAFVHPVAHMWANPAVCGLEGASHNREDHGCSVRGSQARGAFKPLALTVVSTGRVSFSVRLAFGNAFSHAWLRPQIEAFVGWALPTKKTVWRTWSTVAGTMIKAKPCVWGPLRPQGVPCEKEGNKAPCPRVPQ